MTAEDSSTGNQTTQYLYGVSTATGSNITSNDLLYQTVYPPVSGLLAPVSSSAYNALGQVISTTDRNGNVHNYTYDNFGRQISDTVTTLGAGVDGSVQRIDTAYNNQGLAYLLTSYADTAGTQIVNQVENIYNGLGQLTQQYQAVTGAVDTSSTPYVGYNYSDPSNGSLLTGMVYPNGRTINYNYGDTGGVLMSNSNAMLDNAIGRLDGIVDGANSGDAGQVLEQYSYLGLSTIVARNHPQTGINLTLIGPSGSIGAGGDQYVGLDQLGRIVNQNWVNSTGSTVDGYTYSYDANSNVTARNNVLDSAYSETYTYDSLNRLTSVSRGGAAYQSWNLDAQGNWSSFTSSGNTQTRTANAQNQITSVSGQTTPTYDANGNMISDQNGDTLTYNAWNQLVKVTNSAGQVIAQYTYDAQGWRISETYPVAAPGIPAGTTKNLYYSSQWQVVEERWNGTAACNVQYQYVWSAAYVNGMVLRDTYLAGAVQPDLRVYTANDANYNVTALVGYNPATRTWGVVERFVYSPYGTVTVLSPAWTVQADAFNWQYLYQGGRQDTATGLYLFQHRNYSPSLGTWISQDPLQYINGANTYQFVMSNPVGRLDFRGTQQEGATPPSGTMYPFAPGQGPAAEDNGQVGDNDSNVGQGGIGGEGGSDDSGGWGEFCEGINGILEHLADLFGPRSLFHPPPPPAPPPQAPVPLIPPAVVGGWGGAYVIEP
jgi:RHS repeat-associated protein